MNYRRSLLTLVLLIGCGIGCEKKQAPELPKDLPKDQPMAQVPIGGDGSEPPHLAFKIDKVYEKQQPNETGHADGGEWTFFDASTTGAEAAHFTFGFHAKKSASAEMPFSFGEASFAVPDRVNGERFVAQFAKAFKETVPPAGQARPLVPMRFSLAVLGENNAKSAGGGFGGAGSWTATKLFVELAGLEQGEIFFNFSVQEKAGEFSEKDAEYNVDVLKNFAAGLRDVGAK